MERKSTQGYFISDEELLAALEDSEFEFDDLDNDPNFVPNDESDDDEQQDKGETTGAEGDQTENQIGNIRPTTTETGTSFESENEDLGLDLDLSAAGPSRQPANVGLTLRGKQCRGRGTERGRGTDRGRRERRGRGGRCGRDQQRGRGGGDGDGCGRRPEAIWAGETLDTDFPPFLAPADERCMAGMHCNTSMNTSMTEFLT
ncbi:hypothetical protein J6590_006575 [Homalodisca vitripennis]|nr:hypothetical protein J6590_006575 [Homalodisca vitripennis]